MYLHSLISFQVGKADIIIFVLEIEVLNLGKIGTLFNVYLFLRQRESMNRGGSEREGDTESETGSRL